MLPMVKDNIEEENTNKTDICFVLQSVLEMLYDLQTLSYAVFWVFLSEDENRCSFLCETIDQASGSGRLLLYAIR